MVENNITGGLNVPTVLSAEQQEILDMLTCDYETPRNIAVRRKTSLTAVYKTIAKLKEKGYLTRGFNRGLKNIQSTQPKHLKQFIRLHGQEWNIQIIAKSDFYRKLEKNTVIFVDSNTVRLYEDSIEVYANEHLKFEAEDEQRATALSFNYWTRLFTKLENRLKVIIVKQYNQNIRLVNCHYAEVNNELAKECNEKKVKLRVFTTDEGKLWFTIDHSWNFNEAETVHPETSKPDMAKVKAHFNDLRDKQSYLPSETKERVDMLGKAEKNTVAILGELNSQAVLVTEQMKSMGQFISGTLTRQQQDLAFQKGIVEQIFDLKKQLDVIKRIRFRKESRISVQSALGSYFGGGNA